MSPAEPRAVSDRMRSIGRRGVMRKGAGDTIGEPEASVLGRCPLPIAGR